MGSFNGGGSDDMFFNSLVIMVGGVSIFFIYGGEGKCSKEKGVYGDCVYVYGAIILLCHIQNVFSESRE